MSPEDDKLVSFLRQHRPLTPLSEANLEGKLMQIIENEVKTPRKSPVLLFSTLTGLMAALILILCGQSRWFQPIPQADNFSDEDLSAFLLDSWSDAMGEPRNYTPANSPQMRGTALTEPRLTYSSYYP